MKIITWNCNMAFRKKAAAILALEPDLLVIPECEHPDRLQLEKSYVRPSDSLWFGENRHKGLGIFAYNGLRLKLRRMHNPILRMIVPITVKGEGLEWNLYAVWANNPGDPDGPYVEQVWKALKHYNRHLGKGPSILIGDFNSNTIWDRARRIGNHSHVVERLGSKKIFSAYHLFHKMEQGREEHPTLYMYRHRDKPYHIDYCFISQELVDRLENVEIGKYDQWIGYSDHVPLIVSFKKRPSV